MSDVILAKAWAFLYALCPAILGAVISFISTKQEQSKIMSIGVFCCGVGVAHFFGNATIEYFRIEPASYTASSIILTFGLFGLATIREIFIQLPEIIRETRERFIGGK